jgi:hypothetical protein
MSRTLRPESEDNLRIVDILANVCPFSGCPWRIVISGNHRACNALLPAKRPADAPYLNVADFKGIRAG